LDDSSIHAEHPASSTDSAFALYDGTTGDLKDSSYTFNDSGTSTTNIWSANKIQNVVDTAVAGLDFQADVLDIQTDATLDPGAAPTTGDRYIITDSASLHSNFGTITGVGDNDIVEWTGSAFEVLYDVSVQGEGAMAWDQDSDTFQFYNGSTWQQHGGLTGITAGVGLSKDGNTLHVNLGGGIKELPTYILSI